ncbi:MAG: ATP-binding cassette domain-containing protein [Planctomycetaceae bacterium]|nr:ATP-binding cassette domain-containing protein [Planctomycetaceae bacterium]
MPLITLRDVTIGFRGPPLLDAVSCQIDSGQRIGLLGRNGAGKSTLLKLLSGELETDSGEIVVAPGTKIAQLPQDVPLDVTGRIREVVAAGIPQVTNDHDAAWRAERQVEQILSRMELAGDAEFATLSSGMKRRVLLARALVAGPDVLLLDEPTNHLDVEAIAWLEQFLLRSTPTLIFVTHDRVFLRKLSNRILEIDRGRLFDWSCDYDTFLRRKEEALAAEDKQNALFDKRLAEEEVWIRTGIKARRTRNEGRVRALKEMRRERAARRETAGPVKMVVQAAERGGVLVAEAEGVSFAYDGRSIVNNFSTTILRGDKIGIVGRNGAGKTTLLRLLLGQLAPQSGRVRIGANLQIAYFDQLRRTLNEEASVVENVGDGSDAILFNGKPRHVLGYLQDFLFSAERARTAVKFLSGGERNRVLLAKLFAKPANVVVLDEPTNDLDSETLELLEELLAQFEGTVVVVSHDREFLNNVVTGTIVFEDGEVNEYVGGYDDYARQRAARPKPTAERTPRENESSAQSRKAKELDAKKRRLSFKELQEYQKLTSEIDDLETAIAALHSEMAKTEFYQRTGNAIARKQDDLRQAEQRLEAAMSRWEELAPFVD